MNSKPNPPYKVVSLSANVQKPRFMEELPLVVVEVAKLLSRDYSLYVLKYFFTVFACDFVITILKSYIDQIQLPSPN